MSSTAIAKPSDFGTVSQRALDFVRQNQAAKGEFSEGIGTGFSVLSFRGKVWRIKHGGEETILEREVDGEKEARTSIELVFVKAGAGLSKNYYASGYVEGSSEKPDCYSSNGVKPEADSPNKQSATCAGCRHNVFGSRISADGQGKGKACADSKRMAVVPGSDLDNERWGGPMLMRVPAASLKDLAQYSRTMEAGGYPLIGIVTRVAFDTTVAHPQLVFKPVRVLSDAEVDQVIMLRDDARTTTILETTIEHDAAPAEKPDVTSMFEQPPEPKADAKADTKPEVKPDTSAADAAKAKAAADAKAKADAKKAETARLAAELDAKEKAEAAANAEPEEDEDERELRLAQERVAAKKAAKAKAEAEAAANAKLAEDERKAAATTATTKPEVEDAEIVSEDADAKAAAPTGVDDFDAMLDDMLA